MADKRTIQVSGGEDDAKNDELEKHVDRMMDKSLPDEQPATSIAPAGAPDLPEIDIFEGKDIRIESTDNDSKTEKVETTSADPAADNENITADPSVESPSIDPLIDDIVSNEGNELLAAQDAEIARAFNDKPLTFKQKVKNFFAAWWHNKKARYGTIAGVAALLIVAGVIPSSRYFMLNTAGVRAQASLTILDKTTGLPLKNVTVTLGDQNVRTNSKGTVQVSSVKLGSQLLTVRQLGFAKVSQTVTLGLGSNPLGEFSLRAVGTQFTFKLTDYLSGKAVSGAEVSSGEANAKSDAKGHVVLTIGKIEAATLNVKVAKTHYRTEKVAINTTEAKETPVTMVTDRKEVYVSKQSGKYDVYKIDIDGKNKQVLLPATGLERSQLTLVSHVSDNEAALVSSRNDKRNQDGYLLDTLTIIDVSDGSTLTLDSSEEIRLIDWVGDKLVYLKIKAGTSAGNPERFQLISYDYKTANRQQLAAANYFNDIVAVKGTIYYAFSDNYRGGPSQFVKVNADNTGKQTLLGQQVWNIVRTSYDDLSLYTYNNQERRDNWYLYHVGDSEAKKLAQAPSSSYETRSYLDAADGKHSLWTESRDGKGALLVYDTASRKDTVLTTQSGLTQPLRWLDSRTVVYRIATSQETASYAKSLDGGEARRIVDVTAVGGLGGSGQY